MQEAATQVVLHGQEVVFTDRGTGQTVLLVHGLMSTRHTWDDQLDRLARDYRVIAPDLLGHGDSAKPAGDYSLGAHAAMLRDLLDVLEVPRVTIVGHSLGGGIAMQFAYLFPDRTDRLVLVSSGGLGREVSPALRAATLPGSELVLPLLGSGFVRGVGDCALRLWSRVGLPAISPSSTQGWRSLAGLADPASRRAFLATSRSVINAGGQTVSAQDRLTSLLSHDLMLMWGRRDRVIPISHIETTLESLPRSHVVVLSRSGHFPHLDEPELFAIELDSFLKRPTSGGPTRAEAARPARQI